jgi:hypothetical protein
MKISAIALLSFLPLAAYGQDATQPPAGAKVRFVTRGVGTQIYACTATGGAFVWVFLEPQADLVDAKKFHPVGTHSKGPTWTWKDGSAITGKVLHQQPSPDADKNIPWLLLETQSNGSKGALSKITYVRRSETDGGVAATAGCSEATVGTTSKVPYKATYTFYSTEK